MENQMEDNEYGGEEEDEELEACPAEESRGGFQHEEGKHDHRQQDQKNRGGQE